MRVLVTGASGNVGTALLRRLREEPEVHEIVGLARRVPAGEPDAKVRWVTADVAADPLEPLFHGVDAVVHLAWLIQPSRRPEELTRVNVGGSRRVFEAAAGAGVPALVYASSVGAYSPGPKDERVDESWPTEGVPTSQYSREKAAVERILDEVERDRPELRVVRLRPGLIFQAAAASEIFRYFLGAFVPAALLRPGRLPVLPLPAALRIQGVHADDVAAAYTQAVLRHVRGAFNVAAEPVLDPPALAEALGSRAVVPLPELVLRLAADLSWRVGLQPTTAGWVDLALNVPLLDTTRARTELGWTPRVSATDAVRELAEAMAARTGGPTPPLRALDGWRARVAAAVRRGSPPGSPGD
ncbi:MAG: NAD-dependent epimerase/dehydratase family protein [Mycobacterium leprae]